MLLRLFSKSEAYASDIPNSLKDIHTPSCMTFTKALSYKDRAAPLNPEIHKCDISPVHNVHRVRVSCQSTLTPKLTLLNNYGQIEMNF